MALYGRKIGHRLGVSLLGLAALLVAIVLVALFLTLVVAAWPAIARFGWGLIGAAGWAPNRQVFGLGPALYGTVVSGVLALGLAVPVGVGVALLLTEEFVFLPRSLQGICGFLIDLLAAIPSVVYGLWGIFVLIPALGPLAAWLHGVLGDWVLFATPFLGRGMLPAVLVLALMVLPTIAAIARQSLGSLDRELRVAAMAVGATRWEAVRGVLLPAAGTRILGGVLLALGRALGETMAVTMLIGNVPDRIEASLLAPSSTIASLIANEFAEARGLQVAVLMYGALVLLGLVAGVHGLAEGILQWRSPTGNGRP
jgi:phosphate transport system permease protein